MADSPRSTDGASTVDSTTESTVQSTETAPPTEPSDFYIVNLHFETRRFSLTVRRPGGTLVDDEFEVPASTGVIFEDVGEIDGEYSVVAAVSDGPEVSATWRVTACAGTEAPGGNSDGGIRLGGETLEFEQNQCDVVTIGTRKIEYVEPDNYRV